MILRDFGVISVLLWPQEKPLETVKPLCPGILLEFSAGPFNLARKKPCRLLQQTFLRLECSSINILITGYPSIESLKVACEALEKGKQRKEAVLLAMQQKSQKTQPPMGQTPNQPSKRVRGKVTPTVLTTPSTKTPDAKNPRLGGSAKKALF